MTPLYHITPTANLPSILSSGLKPQIGIRAQAAGETTPAVFLFPSIDAAENALLNWLGDAMEDTPLTLLKVDLAAQSSMPSSTQWELMELTTIPPAQITILHKDI